ncbi:Transporter [Rhodovulum sp. PH10]|uniref:Tim44/TimA family putative adaptor protein n=1 Tax=Rhodovulum sp. PH10 TaxID=1187851 RepID=UPI00027C249A|nr:Tim44/TimA family putative adaptor protein [Rhodovulum sp. PH10]EJW13080.1 Transporter [Rhodovulum sp. PH10]
MFDTLTFIFLGLAVFIFLRLRSVLGQRTGRERPPYDPFSSRDAVRNNNPANGPANGAANDKVVALPQRGEARPDIGPRPAEPTVSLAERLAGVVPTDSPAAAGLEAIMAADPEFDPKHFLAGARAAYEMIVSAFAEGDRRTLRNLLSKDVFDGFEAAIRDRESRGETVETRFVSIDEAAITGAELRGRNAQVTLRFVSQLVTATRDRAGAVVDGHEDKVTEVTDVWTFARDVTSRDPNWKLVATEAGQ